MNLDEFQALLSAHPDTAIRFVLPDGDVVPAHFHVTEVGRVRKDFIDCGGTVRSSETCQLQLWVAEDVDHRLATSRLAQIIGLAAPLLGGAVLPVEVEYEDCSISQYPLAGAEMTAEGVSFLLAEKHTDCLAKERCGIPEPAGTEGCKPGGACC